MPALWNSGSVRRRRAILHHGQYAWALPICRTGISLSIPNDVRNIIGPKPGNRGMTIAIVPRPQVTLRTFSLADFEHLISWVPTQQAQWCAAFFQHPLDQNQLRRYLDSASQPNVRTIFAAVDQSGDTVGHVEISMIWPHLSSRLFRILVAPARRGEGIGGAMVARAVAFSFETHNVDRIDLGVAANNAPAIACYRKQGFAHVGTWLKAILVETVTIDVYWMTLTRAAWLSSKPSVNGR
jgi:RimJ/RimL family protein N-acetyltransferase